MYKGIHEAERFITTSRSPAVLGTLAIMCISAVLLLSHSNAASARQEPVRVENGFEGSLAEPPTIIEQVRIEDPPTGEALLYDPKYFLFNTQGDVYIPDEQAYTVFLFDRDGNLKRRIGREGNGPGEFQCPSEVHISWEGELVVVDPGTQRINYFTTDGEFLRSKNIQVTRGNRRASIRVLDADRERIPTSEGYYIHRWMFEPSPAVRDMVQNRALPGISLFEIINDEDESVMGFGDIHPYEDAWVEMILNRRKNASRVRMLKGAVQFG